MAIIYKDHINNQPPQSLPSKKKNEEWKEANMDWIEQLLKSYLPEKKKRLLKNYNLAQGVIEVEDYIKVQNNDYNNIFDDVENAINDSITENLETIQDDLHFYPIIPTIINTLVGELVKKYDHIKVKSVDDLSTNETLEYKKELITQYLTQKYQQKFNELIQEQGASLEDEKVQEQGQQFVEQKMSLPDIQKFMNKKYQSNYETWANKILEQAEFKYRIKEKEIELFKHQLISDEAYVEIKINEDDVELINWNPFDTIVIKPNHIKYTSDADLVARQYNTTVNEIVSKYKDKIDVKILEKYDTNLSVNTALSDKRISPEDNLSHMHQEKKLIAFKYLMNNVELEGTSKVLVTEGYWVSRRKLGKLTAIYEGEQISKIVEDDFKITLSPEYDENKNLIAGEEIEYFYAPQVWKGTKISFSGIGVNSMVVDENEYLKESFSKNKKTRIEGDLYIDVQPIEYQFTDEIQPFRPKIPVVGCDGFERTMNVGKLSLIDKTKAYQILYNGFMNEIDSLAKNEIGLFYVMDQRLIPQNSLDGTWGKYNWAKFILTAKETGLGVTDNSASNLEGGAAMQQPTVINLLNNERFKSRIDLANFCEQQILKIIGVSPQRMGSISSQETATGVNQAINNSYSQTELYFNNHTQLMREIKSLLLDAEKYIESKKPISRVNYLNSEVENVMFEIDTENLLLRRFNIYLTSDSNTQRVLEQLRQLAIQNNTSGASMLDLATIIESNDTRKIKDVLALSVQNMQKQQEEQRQHEQQMLEQKLNAEAQEKEKEREFVSSEKEKDRQKDMYIAEVKAVGFAKDNDLDNSGINDVLEVARFNEETNKNYNELLSYQSEAEIKRNSLKSKENIEKEKLNLKKQELASKERLKTMEINRDLKNQINDLQIAKEHSKNRKNK